MLFFNSYSKICKKKAIKTKKVGKKASPFPLKGEKNVFKRLELQGFKSFADKTILELRPGITTVIGPNGSEKVIFLMQLDGFLENKV